MSSYFRVRLQNVSNLHEDEITQYCMKFGATGLSEALAYAQPDLTYEPDILHRRSHDIDVYFEAKPAEEFFQGLAELSSQIQYVVAEEEHKDWLAEWKKGFVPFQLAGPYWIVPSWIPSPVEEKFTITIDPGMAFGTGTHATTKMASYFVNKACAKITEPEKRSLIDVGTGTGILAMLAKKHHIGRVLGIEIDPEARRVARENIKLNHLEDIEVSEQVIEDVIKTGEKFDIIVANIIDGVLIKIKPELLRLVKPGGQLFLTGILLEREEIFFKHFLENSDLQILRRIEEDEWVGFWVST
jgi:ribosomal protein L11 methyltransferase